MALDRQDHVWEGFLAAGSQNPFGACPCRRDGIVFLATARFRGPETHMTIRRKGQTLVAILTATSALVAQGETAPALPLPPKQRAAGATAQDKTSQKELIRLRDEKLALPVFKKADWTFDYDAARARAKKEGKVIFTYFSRSYAH